VSDADKIHRWLSQAELDQMLSDAYQRGAEAMREAAALECDDKFEFDGSNLARAIRALPIPEDKS